MMLRYASSAQGEISSYFSLLFSAKERTYYERGKIEKSDNDFKINGGQGLASDESRVAERHGMTFKA
jgi:hypothetical protein